MFLSVCGFNHKTANLQEREPFQIPRAELTEVVSQYKRLTGAEEAVVVSTCNRVEFYRVLAHKSNQYEEIIRLFNQRGIEDASILRDICYCHQGTTAARHLFRVTAGLDSLVLGEDQVLHQVKEAYSSACAVNGPGKFLHKVFHLAFQIAKSIRSETGISSGSRNIPSAALELLHKKMNGAAPEKALVCGVNKLTEIVLEHLTRRRIPTILANRTLYHAQKMAGGYGAEPAPLEGINELLKRVDVVITAAAGSDYLISPAHLGGISKEGKKLYIVDISVPRNVDPEVGNHPGVRLLDLQDLKRHLDVTASRRNEEIPLAEEMIEEQVTAFSGWRAKVMKQENLLKLREALNHVRKAELEKFKESFRKGDYKALEAFSGSIMREFLRMAPYLLDENGTPVELDKTAQISEN